MKTIDSIFCPHISTVPIGALEPLYAKAAQEAVDAYPGANGDPVRALSFCAVHRKMSIENAKENLRVLFPQEVLPDEHWIQAFEDWQNG